MIKPIIDESIKVKESVYELTDDIQKTADSIINCYENKGKILICGNGGSAADAQHMAGELVGRFKLERKPLACIALTTNTSIITAWSNDYDFDSVFERQVEALGNKDDILIGISTSGNSKNIINAMKKAKEMNMKTVSLLGNKGGEIKKLADVSVIVKSNNTPRIQEAHIMIIHILCELVEKRFFS